MLHFNKIYCFTCNFGRYRGTGRSGCGGRGGGGGGGSAGGRAGGRPPRLSGRGLCRRRLPRRPRRRSLVPTVMVVISTRPDNGS